MLKERETSNMDAAMSSPVNGNQPGLGDMPASQTIPKPSVNSRGGTAVSGQRLDRKQIEQRLEEDRERHKRLRESIWAVPTDTADAEMWKMWEETSDLGDDDFLLAEEEEEERKRCVEDSCTHRQDEETARRRNGNGRSPNGARAQ